MRWLRAAAVPLFAIAVALANVLSLWAGMGRLNTIFTDGLFALALMTAVYQGGTVAGLVVVAVATLYFLVIFSWGAPFGHVGPVDAPEAIGVPLIFMAVIALVDRLRHQERRANRLQVENTALARRHQAAEAQLAAIVEYTSDVVFVVDFEGRYTLINPAFEALMGMPAERIIGRSHRELFPTEVAEAFEASDRRALETQGPVRLVTAMADGPGGTRHFDTTKFPYRDEGGRVVGVAGIARDVSDRIRAERAIAEQNARLQDLDRMKNDFVSAVSHDLRTPLTAIKGYVEFLEDGIGGELTPSQAEFVSQLHAGTLRLERLVDDLLDFARLETGQFNLSVQESDASSTVRRVAALLQPLAGQRGITLTAAAPDEVLPWRFDPARMEQVLINLVANGLKFTPSGGRVTVGVKRELDGLRFEVTDTGVGIPIDAQPRLFDRFYQVDPSVPRATGGIGLGLTIAKALVDAHGGRIGVTSEPGHGSTFWVTLPNTLAPGA